MEERVTIRNGNVPVLLVCPHGHDDTNTDIITETCAEYLDCYSLINHGWKRAKHVDELNGMANCNSIAHVMDEDNFVINDEYGKEFLRFRKRIKKNCKQFYIVHVHGVGNHIKKKAKDNIHVIFGHGNSKKNPSLTCDDWVPFNFGRLFAGISGNPHGNAQGQGGWIMYQGKPGGLYTARKNDNMNQYYRKKKVNSTIQSFQLEFTYDMRHNQAAAEFTGNALAQCLNQLVAWDFKDPTGNSIGSRAPEMKEI